MRVKVWRFGSQAIDSAWPAVKHLVEKSLDGSLGRLDADDVLSFLREDGMQLWALITAEGEPEVVAVLVTEVIQYPKKRVLDLAFMAGDRLELWQDALPVVESWALENAVDQIQIQGRKGWERVTGYPACGVLMVKEMAHG